MGCGASVIKGSKVHNDASSGLDTVLPDAAPQGTGRASSSTSGLKNRADHPDDPGSKAEERQAENPEKKRSRDRNSKQHAASRSDKQTKRLPHHRNSNRKSTAGKDDSHGGEAVEKTDLSEDERRFLHKVLSKHFLFCYLGEHEMQVMMEHMERRTTENHEIVFQQGEKADRFFVIMSGTYTVSIDDRVLKQLKQKQSFGELALLYNVKRTATITCTQVGVLWALPENRFRQAMKSLNSTQRGRVKTFLQSAPILCRLSAQDRSDLSETATVQVFQKGEIILREGEVGDWMFVIMEGTVQMVDQQGNMTTRHSGYIVGAVGIMCTKRQLFGAKALDMVTCIALGRQAVHKMSKTVQALLRRCALRSLVCGGFSASRDGDLEFFGSLYESQQEAILDKLEEVTCHDGMELASAGSEAQYFVVTEGEVAMIQNAMVAQAGGGALHLKEYAREVIRPGGAFGGKHITDNTKMKDSAFALQPTKALRIDIRRLTAALGGPIADVLRRNEIKTVLSDVFFFKNLHEDQIDMTIRALQRRKYAQGEVVVKQGDDAKHFFLIQSGTVSVIKNGTKLRSLGRWDYFGERGLLLQEKRSATCEAETSCCCLILGAESFGDIVGMFRRDLEHRMYLQDLDVTMADLELQAIVGRGTFGTVKLVNHFKDTSKTYALKCVEKGQVVEQRQEKQILVERGILAECYHPCVVQFIKTFQDETHIYFLTEFLGGGDLFFVIREIGALTKEHAQFYSGSIVLALEYLHGRSIMYRDLKPENVLLDFSGNAKLVDFGCCKKALRSTTLVGTPEYLAPEVILGKGYTAAVDWWAVGVMLHEFVVGPLPFGKDTADQLELFREILESPLEFPPYVTDETAVAIISGLLERSPEYRIGVTSRGAKEIQEHRYYQDFDWRALLGHYLRPPWSPDVEKIRATWEVGEGAGQRLTSGNRGPVDTTKLDPSMEWSAVF